MRTIHELLVLLRDNARVKDGRIYAGLCDEAHTMWFTGCFITVDELILLNRYIKYNRPEWIEFKEWGWTPKLWQPRLKWLNEQIELTKPKSQKP